MESIPSVIAILICDRIIVEAGTGKKSVIGVFGELRGHTLPMVVPIGFYARLTDAEGKYIFRVDVVYSNESEQIGRLETEPIAVANRLGFVELALNLPPLPFPRFGRYEFQLYGNDVYLGHVTMDVCQIGETGHGSA
jgi:hypothetical protein